MNPIPDSKASLAFLQRLYPADQWVLAAIGLEKEPMETTTFCAEEAEECLAWIDARNGRRNLYFHVNPPLRRLSKKASRADVKEVAFLHCDVDPRAGEDLIAEQDRVLAILTQRLPADIPAPTVVTFSGGGYQAFWRLETPIEINGDVEAAEAAGLYNQRLSQMLGGDNCHSVDHLMRLPGTLNLPDARKKRKGREIALARLVTFDESRVYSLQAFRPAQVARTSSGLTVGRAVVPVDLPSLDKVERLQSVDVLDEWQVPARLKLAIVQGPDPDNPKKGDNTRSGWVHDVACNLDRCGVPDEIIYSVLTDPGFGISESILEKPDPAAHARREIDRAHERAINPALVSMNDMHAVVMNYGGKVRILYEGDRPLFQRQDDFKLRYSNRAAEIQTDNGTVKTPLADWWLRCAERREYQRVEFAPGQILPPDVFNMWRGFSVKAVPGCCDLFLTFVREVIAGRNQDHAEWLFDFLAHAVQKPWEPAEVAVALRGGQGLGKSYFVERFGELFAPHFVAVTDPKHVVGNFNYILHDALVLFADEAFAAPDKRNEGILKGLVTQSHITIEPKGVDAFKAKRYARIFLASNHQWLVPADVDDRRFLVLDVAKDHQRDFDYFAAIQLEWDAGGREAFFAFLRGRDLTKFNHRNRPNTAGLTDQKLHSLRGAARVVFDALAAGDVPVVKVDGERVFVATNELASLVKGGTVTSAALSAELLRASPDAKASRELCPDGKQKRGVWLSPLNEARARWASSHGLDVVWPEDDEEWTGSTLDPF